MYSNYKSAASDAQTFLGAAESEHIRAPAVLVVYLVAFVVRFQRYVGWLNRGADKQPEQVQNNRLE